MTQQEVFNKVGAILQELNDQYEYLKNTNIRNHEIELELFVANANFLRDHAEILRKQVLKQLLIAEKADNIDIHEEKNNEIPITLEHDIVAVEETGNVKEKFFEPVVQRLAPVNLPSLDAEEKETNADSYVKNSDVENEDGEDSGTIRHELIIDEADMWEDEDELVDMELYNDVASEEPSNMIPIESSSISPEPIEEEIEPEVAVEPIINTSVSEPESIVVPVETSVVVDSKGDEPVVTINQKISVQMNDRKMPDLLPISDLKTAINLNDKLLYIKDLFNGYSLAYSEVIEKLNRFNSFEEAEHFLKANYVTKNNWESKPDTVAKFYELLHRRYAS